MVSAINRLKEPKSGLMISDCSSFFHASGDGKGFWDSDAVGIIAEGCDGRECLTSQQLGEGGRMYVYVCMLLSANTAIYLKAPR